MSKTQWQQLMEAQMSKTKWQQLVDAPKGSTEYNPTQSFALQVFWVVRSPKAASEMIEKGFRGCAKATMRDTPTTMAYIFRISRDQRLAAKFKDEVKTMGQHPHYQPTFKGIQMGISQDSLEMKLKLGGIDLTPLSWGPDEPISGHEIEIDFDPVVLECTEVYLDNRSFYQHSASKDWMKSYPEIMKASRSLKATTFSLGQPHEEIWQKVLEPYLKAIRFSNDDRKQVKAIQPGLSLCSTTNARDFDQVFFLEIDLMVRDEKLQTCRSQLSSIQQELEAPFMVILPTNLEDVKDLCEVRVMLSFPYLTGMKCPSLGLLAVDCNQAEGRVIVFDGKFGAKGGSVTQEEGIQQRNHDAAQRFLKMSGMEKLKISILDGDKARKANLLEGFPLHPLFLQLVPNDQLNYQV